MTTTHTRTSAGVRVYGSSDDLVEVEGDVSEEFTYGADTDEGMYLGFSDGTVLGVTYDRDGVWRINRLIAGLGSYTKSEAISDEGRRVDEPEQRVGLFETPWPDLPAYSDIVTLGSPRDDRGIYVGISWVVAGSGFAKR